MPDTPGDATGDGGGATAGQPVGSEPSRAATETARTEPGIGEVFTIPATRLAIKGTPLTYAVVGVGFAVIAAGIGTFGQGGIADMAVGSTALISIGLVVFCPILAVIHGYRHGDAMGGLPDKVVYATTAIANALGVVAICVVGTVFAFAAAPPSANVGEAIGRAVVPVIVVMVGVAIVSAGTAWGTRQGPPAHRQSPDTAGSDEDSTPSQ